MPFPGELGKAQGRNLTLYLSPKKIAPFDGTFHWGTGMARGRNLTTHLTKENVAIQGGLHPPAKQKCMNWHNSLWLEVGGLISTSIHSYFILGNFHCLQKN